jgi:hypothetical protein
MPLFILYGGEIVIATVASLQPAAAERAAVAGPDRRAA